MLSKYFLISFVLLILIHETQSCKTARKDPEYRIFDVKINRKGKTLTDIVLKTFKFNDLSFGKTLNVPLSPRRIYKGSYIGSIPGDVGGTVIVERFPEWRKWDYEDNWQVRITSDKSGYQAFAIFDKLVFEMYNTSELKDLYALVEKSYSKYIEVIS